MLKKTTLAIALSSLFVGAAAQAATIYTHDNGDTLQLYGEVGVGGHIGADYEYGEFYEDNNYIDDSFATLGVKGNYDAVYYRLELDYERENWRGGTGEMVLAVDKAFIGYHLNDDHALEFGLTDTAFDDYDKYGDFTFDTTVETGEAGDQANTMKYEGRYQKLKMGISYSYEAETSSGAKLGDVGNAYLGYFTKQFSAVFGIEQRAGSGGESSYGKQMLYGFGARYMVNDRLSFGVNGFFEEEDRAKDATNVDIDPINPGEFITVYNNFQTVKNHGALISTRYLLNKQWDVTGSYNYETREAWDIDSIHWDTKDSSWGKERHWGTVGVNFRPSSSVVFAIEGNVGEAAQNAYAYARVYF